jgi:proton-coupled amino acid transporter
MVGFACYTFEGIGVVMPIMHACECPDKFPKILLYAFITLTALYCIFGNLCYLVMGPKMANTFIIEELDQKSLIIILLNLIYSVNLVCSYAIVIYPTNTILEEYLFSGLSKRINNRTELGRKYKRLRYNLQNFSRFLVCLSAIYLAVELREKMDKFLSLLGALLCAPLAVLYPALLHLVGIAKTKREKMGDIVLLVIALTVMTFSTVQSVSTW